MDKTTYTLEYNNPNNWYAIRVENDTKKSVAIDFLHVMQADEKAGFNTNRIKEGKIKFTKNDNISSMVTLKKIILLSKA